MKLTEAGMGRAEIIERLEKLTGPDREVDALIWCAVLPAIGEGIDGYGCPDGAQYEYEAAEDGSVSMYVRLANGMTVRRARRAADVYTASLDAAVALVEKMGDRPEDMLPEAIEALLTDGYRDDAPRTPQFAIALLLALFRSLPDTEER